MSAYIFNFNEYQDLALIEIGRQKCTPLYSFGPFIRNEYIFHYILSGKGYCSYGHLSPSASHIGRNIEPEGGPPEFEIKAGEGFLLEPHTKHLYYADETDPWHYIWVVFRGLSVPQYLRDCGLSKTNAVYRPKDYSNQTAQKIRFHLLSILENPNSESSFIIGHFLLFFSELIKNSACHNMLIPPPGKNDTLSNYYLTQAIRYINGNYPNIRSLDEIARFCNISRSHLGRIFRENLHTSLQGYLVQYRLSKTRDLLSNTRLPISEIAIRVGYQNELNLLRAFKKAYGVSPNSWRNQNTL